MSPRRAPPPIWLIVPTVFLVLTAASVALVRLLGLPWRIRLPGVVVAAGLVLFWGGLAVICAALGKLSVRRAFGREMYSAAEESRLVTSGLYARSRNPLYVGVTGTLLGLFLVFGTLVLLLMAVLYAGLVQFIARWEERELRERFGEEYEAYRSAVPRFLPRLRDVRKERHTT